MPFSPDYSMPASQSRCAAVQCQNSDPSHMLKQGGGGECVVLQGDLTTSALDHGPGTDRSWNWLGLTSGGSVPQPWDKVKFVSVWVIGLLFTLPVSQYYWSIILPVSLHSWTIRPPAAVLHFETWAFLSIVPTFIRLGFFSPAFTGIYLLAYLQGLGAGGKVPMGEEGEMRADPGQDQLLFFIFDKVIKAVVTC